MQFYDYLCGMFTFHGKIIIAYAFYRNTGLEYFYCTFYHFKGTSFVTNLSTSGIVNTDIISWIVY